MFEKMINLRLTSRLLTNNLRSFNRTNYQNIKLLNRNLNLILRNNLCNYLIRNDNLIINQQRFYSDNKKEELKSEDKINQINDEIDKLEKQIKQLKSEQKNKDSKIIEVGEGKYDKQSDDDEIIYRRAYDFPGFKLKNIKVSVVEQILKIYAFQKGSKKDKETKEYIYENRTEEILPDEIDVNKIRAIFDSENGFLIVEAILPEDCNLDEINEKTNKKNDKLIKLEKELEAKKKELINIKI